MDQLDDGGTMDKDTEEDEEDEGEGLPKEGTDSHGLIEVVTLTTQIWGLLTCSTWNIEFDMLQFLRPKSEIQSLLLVYNQSYTSQTILLSL